MSMGGGSFMILTLGEDPGARLAYLQCIDEHRLKFYEIWNEQAWREFTSFCDFGDRLGDYLCDALASGRVKMRRVVRNHSLNRIVARRYDLSEVGIIGDAGVQGESPITIVGVGTMPAFLVLNKDHRREIPFTEEC